jgi:signal transduction histidine kinase
MSERGSRELQESASAALIEHIQNSAEQQRALLARELHDELGGLLVGAVMDLAWAEKHLSTSPTEIKQKLTRARQALAAAIDIKRKVIEDLRPTLLDNVGLFAALRWHVQATCKRAGLACNIQIPEDERRFVPNIPIALFRIVQEAFAVLISHHPASTAVNVIIGSQGLTIRMSNESTTPTAPEMESGENLHILAAIGQRVAALGGEFKLARLAAGNTSITALFPIQSVLIPA